MQVPHELLHDVAWYVAHDRRMYFEDAVSTPSAVPLRWLRRVGAKLLRVDSARPRMQWCSEKLNCYLPSLLHVACAHKDSHRVVKELHESFGFRRHHALLLLPGSINALEVACETLDFATLHVLKKHFGFGVRDIRRHDYSMLWNGEHRNLPNRMVLKQFRQCFDLTDIEMLTFAHNTMKYYADSVRPAGDLARFISDVFALVGIPSSAPPSKLKTSC